LSWHTCLATGRIFWLKHQEIEEFYRWVLCPRDKLAPPPYSKALAKEYAKTAHRAVFKRSAPLLPGRAGRFKAVEPGYPTRKQEFGSPSLQSCPRCQIHAF